MNGYEFIDVRVRAQTREIGAMIAARNDEFSAAIEQGIEQGLRELPDTITTDVVTQVQDHVTADLKQHFSWSLGSTLRRPEVQRAILSAVQTALAAAAEDISKDIRLLDNDIARQNKG